MNIIFQFITNPLKGISTQLEHIRLWHSAIAVFCFSLSLTSTMPHINPLLLLCVTVLAMIWIMVLAIVIDFVAQLTSAPGNSLILFKGLCMSHLLLIIAHPIKILQNVFPEIVLMVLSLTLYAFIIHVQIEIVKKVYQVQTINAFFLLAMPLVFGLSTLTLGIVALIQLFIAT